MEKRRFEQHERTNGHKNQGRKSGQKELPQFSNIPPVEYSDLSISTRILCAWWLAKEDVAIHKFGSLITSQLLSHGYESIDLL